MPHMKNSKGGSRGRKGAAVARGVKKSAGRRTGKSKKSTHAPASRKIQKKTVGARGGLIKGAAVDKGKAAGHQAGLGELSVKQLGHLGGVARWHGSEMAHKELIKMRKGVAKIRRPQRAR